ncbi:ribbon-helix-helix domain-containing protein [Brunnivagina elsteri]|uniref:CopG-like ribbon-helix-helix domain-containing protein n=1 Tax=Brunnivagina elsteri CCALA 953 TaxID=987040 RepID=A0A2A2TLP7_9CYAN|nr:ribbon-helix-helix protein, CopG family [Calothrix elsteri]PAX58339.1 hypothetical protein CK510_07915 [Calothrix elsteri CCALA 953]
MGVTKKAKITFTCSDELKEELQKWANRENRTLSNLIETMAEKAVTNEKVKSQSHDKDNRG